MLIETALVLDILNNKHNVESYYENMCGIENLIYEASDQGTKGMRLVAEVTLNRARNNPSPYAVCETVFDPYQFSWTITPKDKLRDYTELELLHAAQIWFTYVYSDIEPILSEDVLHYLNTDTASDLSWYDPSKVVLKHRDHAFLAGVR